MDCLMDHDFSLDRYLLVATTIQDFSSARFRFANLAPISVEFLFLSKRLFDHFGKRQAHSLGPLLDWFKDTAYF